MAGPGWHGLQPKRADTGGRQRGAKPNLSHFRRLPGEVVEHVDMELVRAGPGRIDDNVDLIWMDERVARDGPACAASCAFAGGSATSAAVTPTMTTARLSSIPVDTRNRLRSSPEAIPARSRGTEKRLLNAPSESTGRTSATLTSRSRPYVVSQSPLHERTSRSRSRHPPSERSDRDDRECREARNRPRREPPAIPRARQRASRRNVSRRPTQTRPAHAPSRLRLRPRPRRVRAQRRPAWRRSRHLVRTRPQANQRSVRIGRHAATAARIARSSAAPLADSHAWPKRVSSTSPMSDERTAASGPSPLA